MRERKCEGGSVREEVCMGKVREGRECGGEGIREGVALE